MGTQVFISMTTALTRFVNLVRKFISFYFILITHENTHIRQAIPFKYHNKHVFTRIYKYTKCMVLIGATNKYNTFIVLTHGKLNC